MAPLRSACLTIKPIDLTILKEVIYKFNPPLIRETYLGADAISKEVIEAEKTFFEQRDSWTCCPWRKIQENSVPESYGNSQLL